MKNEKENYFLTKTEDNQINWKEILKMEEK